MRRALLALMVASSLLPFHLLDSLWHLLDWSTSPVVTKEGCGADPSGHCASAVVPLAGCGADPDGRCVPSPAGDTQDVGCGADPSGRCNPGS